MLNNTGKGLKTAHGFSACVKKTGVCSGSPDMKISGHHCYALGGGVGTTG
jgi:hypothetical protein